ncbi:N-terminal acetyltransferase A, auxiliary subunit [Panus rudis PR-1116 ss-1]|nr:N-terminal acetyltransferase A, auxiliary subunit [Panus rudis PR-1116 ss-1]
MPPAGIPPKRALPSKESSLFKEVLNLYETKQLKKGLKTADAILKKFPEHGETLCMKGLILTHLGRREEGLELVKKGILCDVTSHIVWHVFGLIQKGEKKYEEALKSYTQALKYDKENLNILRDAAHLQAQLRLYDALVDTRHTLLRLRPNQRQNWIGLAVAYHLNGNLTEAKKTLENYESILKNVPDYDVEHSEVLLYHIRVLEELGELSEALNMLDIHAKSRSIIDRTAIMESRARLLSRQGSHDDAEHTWHALIHQNPHNYAYYRGHFSNRGYDLGNVTDEDRSKVLDILQDFSTQLPHASAPRRLALDIATGDEFKQRAERYLFSALEKGIPSLFTDIKSLYKDPVKQQTIESIVEALRERLSTPSPPQPPSETEPPTTYLWTLYFLAQHYSFIGQHRKALELLEIALAHTPTLPELHTFKGRVLKRLGDPYGAARSVDDARLLDLQDRFLNTKCGKYRLRAGLEEEAQEVLGLFTKKDAPNPGSDLEDMQSLLFVSEDAAAFRRNGKLGMALKKYNVIHKIFNEYEDDQFDFHGYSLRRFTINAYLDMLRWEDRLRSHPTYIKSAIAASEIYVSLHDNPSLAKPPTTAKSDAEKKEAKKKAKKAAQKVLEGAKKAATNHTSEDKGLDVGPPKDDDPDGLKLLQCTDPLERAWKFLVPLLTCAEDRVDAWVAIYDVAVRRQKYLQAVKALNRIHSLDPENPELHIRVVDLRKRVQSLPQAPPEPIGPVFSQALDKLLAPDVSLDTYNSQWLQKHSTSAPAILAAAKVLRILGNVPQEEIDSAVFGLFNPELTLDLETAQRALTFLQELSSSRAEEFRETCDKRFELSTVFKPASELPALRKSAIATLEDAKEIAEKVEVVS